MCPDCSSRPTRLQRPRRPQFPSRSRPRLSRRHPCRLKRRCAARRGSCTRTGRRRLFRRRAGSAIGFGIGVIPAAGIACLHAHLARTRPRRRRALVRSRCHRARMEAATEHAAAVPRHRPEPRVAAARAAAACTASAFHAAFHQDACAHPAIERRRGERARAGRKGPRPGADAEGIAPRACQVRQDCGRQGARGACRRKGSRSGGRARGGAGRERAGLLALFGLRAAGGPSLCR